MVRCHKGYKFTRDFGIIVYCVSALSLYILSLCYGCSKFLRLEYHCFVFIETVELPMEITRHSELSIHMECTYRKDRVRERMNRGLSMSTNKMVPMRVFTVNMSVDSSS